MLTIIPSKRLNCSIWPKDGNLTGTTTLGQSEYESNGNERVLHIPQTARLEIQYNVILRTLNGCKYCYLTLSKINLATEVTGNPNASFSIAITPRCRGRALLLSLDPYLIVLSVKQGGIKYHFLSLWYDSTWDWAQVSWTIGEHSNHYANCPVHIIKFNIKHLFAQLKGFMWSKRLNSSIWSIDKILTNTTTSGSEWILE